MSSLHCKETLSPSHWNTRDCEAYTRTDSCTLDRSTRGTVRFNRRYEFIRNLKSGAYGSTVLVRDHTSGTPSGLLVMKFAVADEAFKQEVTSYVHTLNNILIPRVSPNFIIPMAWFVCSCLPPHSSWRKMYDTIDKVPLMEELSNERGQIGVIVMEYGENGTMRTFYKNTLRFMIANDNAAASYSLCTTIFQMVSSLCALEKTRMQHRDISSSNVVFTTLEARRKHSGYRKLYGDAHTLEYTCAGATSIHFSLRLPSSSTHDQMPLYIPLVFDFSMSKVIRDKDGCELESAVTNMWYRAPELLFFPLAGDGPIYSNVSDMFSMGVSIMEMIIGTHLFVEDNPMERTYAAFDRLRGTMRNVPLFRFISQQGRYALRYAWGLYHILGVPTEADIPGIESHPLHSLLVREILAIEGPEGLKSCGMLWKVNPRKLFRESTSIVDQGLIDLLKSMLAWGQHNRTQSAVGLMHSQYFVRLRKQ